MGALDLPSEPEEPDRVRGRAVDRPQARDTPDPDERGRVYEAMRAHVSAETREEASPGRPRGGNYWDEAPGFLARAADYLRRWHLTAISRPCVAAGIFGWPRSEPSAVRGAG